MKKRRPARAAAAVIAAVMCFALTACEKKNEPADSSSSSGKASDVSSVSDNSASPSKVILKDYKFPPFLATLEDPDILSREVYQSFSKKKTEVAVKQQPFADCTCISMIAEKIYTYSEGKYMGVLSADGKTLLKADKYNRITAVSDDIIMCTFVENDKDSSELYRVYENGTVSKIEKKDLSADHIAVSEFSEVDQNTGETFKKQYIQTANGKNVEFPEGNYLWDTAEKTDPQKIRTGKTYRSYYKVSRNGASYYICFDEYQNYVIYEAAYAKIRLKVGNVSGECYVQSFDDYTELSRMVKSFGKAEAATTPDSNETLDYIQITFGLNSPDQQEITVSSDGWCLVDNITHTNQPDNKYFACYDKDSFVSLVLWVDEVISKEYAIIK